MKHRFSRRWALLSGAAVLLGACADGYPTEDGTLVLHHGMNQEATLKAMNTIGHHGYLEHRWRYDVDAGCRLRVRSKGFDGGDAALVADAPGITTRVVAAGGDNSHMVFVHAPGAPTSGGRLVLGGANAFDAGQMKWLMDHLGMLCRAG